MERNLQWKNVTERMKLFFRTDFWDPVDMQDEATTLMWNLATCKKLLKDWAEVSDVYSDELTFF